MRDEWPIQKPLPRWGFFFPILELLVEQRSRIRQGADRDSSILAGFGHFAVILICRCTAEVVLAESWDFFFFFGKKISLALK